MNEPTTKEFDVDDSVSQAKSYAFNTSNCSVVFKMWDVLHVCIRLIKMSIVEVYLLILIFF